ncbi:MAG: hypothetical protein J6S21_01605 [Victivallales bacterium]|nr:hypothetical protein [Victivallales bacterium]
MLRTFVDTASAPELWKKGQLHCHTQWSDGRCFPEEVIYCYRQLNFDFLCLSDHNVFQELDDVWLPLSDNMAKCPPAASENSYRRICELFGDDVCRMRRLAFRTFVRLSTYRELAERFNEAGRFILVPGTEITGKFVDGDGIEHTCHANILHTCRTFPYDAESTVSATLGTYYRSFREAAEQDGRPAFFMANHPWWYNWDVLPQDILDNPEIRHFEIINTGTRYSDPACMEIMSPDKFWDVVLAHRLEDGGSMLYASGSDDAHDYDEVNYGKLDYPGSAWVYARVPGELTPDNITAAMDRGDYYPTTGVILDKVEYDTESRELHVAVKAEPGVSYRIEFYATRRGFDRSVSTKFCRHPATPERSRCMPVYSAEIGRLVKTVEGNEATCAANADDLYIRAKVISSVPGVTQNRPCHPDYLTAWTQPVKC